MTSSTYAWSRFCARALTASVAVLGVAGALAMFLPEGGFLGASRATWCVGAFASMAALSVAGANNAAAAAMHAISVPGGWRNWHWPTLAPALICAAGFAFASNLGVHLGWAILVGAALDPDALPPVSAVDAAALFLCFAKPAMAWIIEGRVAIDKAAAQAADAADEARLAAVRKERLAVEVPNVTGLPPRPRRRRRPALRRTRERRSRRSDRRRLCLTHRRRSRGRRLRCRPRERARRAQMRVTRIHLAAGAAIVAPPSTPVARKQFSC